MNLIYVLTFVVFGSCFAEIPKNTCIYLDENDGYDFSNSIYRDGHYWVAPLMIHFPGCPCTENLTEETQELSRINF